MGNKEIPAKMMQLQLKDKGILYSSYISFFENGGLFVQTEDNFSLSDDVLLVLELANLDNKLFIRTKVGWINPARTSANRPKGIGLAFGADDISLQAKHLIEIELAGIIKNERPTYTL